MSNTMYPSARTAFLTGSLDWVGQSFSVAALDHAGYNPSNENLDDLAGVLATAAITGRVALVNGVADADDLTISGVSALDTVRALVIYRDTGTASTSTLVAWIDETADSTPLERPSDGSPIPIVWSNTPERVFRL